MNVPFYLSFLLVTCIQAEVSIHDPAYTDPPVGGNGIDGGFTDWSGWSSCTLTCGGGSQTRSRSCTNPVPQGDGADCYGDSSETQTCNDGNCPASAVNGGFTSWSGWSSCTSTCGDGSQTRSRSCTNPAPQGSGADCSGDSSETQACNSGNCPATAVNGGFTSWSGWSSCTSTCGDGFQTRSRSCTNPAPQGSGADCSGDSSETQACNSGNCPVSAVVNGGFTSWSGWSSCTSTCGDGSQTRSRSCTNPAPQGGGADCSGDSSETQSCYNGNCPVSATVNGGFTSWSGWSACTPTCGVGSQTRSRSCTNPAPQGSGADCSGDSSETQACNSGNCPANSVNGGFTSWSGWSSCTPTCGVGSQTRSRSCTNPAPQGSGADCSGDSSETQACNNGNCPVNAVNGGFTNWSIWGACTLTCGDGSQTRSRTCTNPAPQNGGADCSGSSSETQACNNGNCAGINTITVSSSVAASGTLTTSSSKVPSTTNTQLSVVTGSTQSYSSASASPLTSTVSSGSTIQCPTTAEKSSNGGMIASIVIGMFAVAGWVTVTSLILLNKKYTTVPSNNDLKEVEKLEPGWQGKECSPSPIFQKSNLKPKTSVYRDSSDIGESSGSSSSFVFNSK